MTGDAVIYEPCWRLVAANLLAAGASVGAAAWLVTWILAGDHRPPARGWGLLLAGSLLAVAVALVIRSLGAFRTPRCGACHGPLDEDHAWLAAPEAAESLTTAVAERDLERAWELTRDVFPADDDLVVVLIETCACAHGGTRVHVHKRRGSKTPTTLLGWLTLTPDEHRDLAVTMAMVGPGPA